MKQLLPNQRYEFVLHKDRYVAFFTAISAEAPVEIGSHSFDLVTVIPVTTGSTISKAWLENLLFDYEYMDDVFSPKFLKHIIFTAESEGDINLAPEAVEFLQSHPYCLQYLYASYTRIPVPGLYIILDQRLIEVWKLVDDFNHAFVSGFIPTNQYTFENLGITGKEAQTLSLAIPSRLKYSKKLINPLDGLRIAVKDNFNLCGIRTSLCNRAYLELYPPSSTTAKCIRELADAGAVIIGNTKLASFAETEEPTQCIDFQAPFNPRADRYQSPAGSSSGSGAAIGSYDWLDISIGSDTSGSGRRPGHWNGCFAMRPTHGSVPMEGFVSSFPLFDTPTFFGRDIYQCRDFAAQWYGKRLLKVEPKFPKAIIYPTDYLPVSNPHQQKIIDDLILDLEKTLGVKHEKVSFRQLWNNAPPEKACGASYDVFMRDAARDSFWYDSYHNFDQFRNDYHEKYHQMPYVSPPVRLQWEEAQFITKPARDEAVLRLQTYKDWFLSTVMRQETRNAVIVLPIEEISPRYRDEPPKPFPRLVGVSVLMLSPVTGSPELTIPAGQIPFLSKVTGQEEFLPVGVSLMALPGSDLMLMDLASRVLKDSGRFTTVSTGKSMFTKHL